MLNRNELVRYGPPGFHDAQKEKDYAQHWMLSFLSRAGFGAVFKGGTALQKVYGLPRYSEDLDFTLNDATEPDYEALAAFLDSGGFSGLNWKKETDERAVKARLRFRGPLYNGSAISEGVIRLKMSRREKTILEPAVAMITPPYPDLLPYQFRVMDKNEMATEKVRAIMTRTSARDLFDLYFLFHQKAGLKMDVVTAKLGYYGLSFDYRTFEKKVEELKAVWKKEMTALTSNPVEYETAAKAALAAVKKDLS
ncbi:MAG: nucleotidyl transferase AbiEii/AbiGii toxin family protein [Candidatus Micrarchaeota archaeon]